MMQPLVHVGPASSLSLCFISLSLSLIFSFSLFFSTAELAPSLVCKDLLQGAYRSPPHLVFLPFYFTTPRAKCAKPVSPTECVPSPRVPLVQFSCFRASHAPRVLISTRKWLATKNTRGCILSRQHILAFISIVFLFLFF